MDIDLSAYHHPEDPRVVVTSCREVFIAAAKHSDYIAAILQRDEAEKSRLRPLYNRLRIKAGIDSAVTIDLENLAAKICGDEINLDCSDRLQYLRDEFRLMAELFVETGVIKTGVSYIPQWGWRTEEERLGGHDLHDFPVLNAIWLSGGTLWQLPDEQNWAQVDEGDFFFMKPKVKHSPEVTTNENDGTPRISMICVPEGAR